MINRFCKVALTEGWSYLILLFVAMPFKYLLGIDILVKIVGWAHGVLFVIYMLLLLQIWTALKWPFKKILWAGFASLIPFATFVLEKQLKKEYSNN